MAAASALLLAGCNKTQPAPATEVAPKTTLATPSAAKSKAAKYSGPFGLAKGISADELTGALKFKAIANNPDLYEGKPPNEVNGFESYIVIATPKAGLCRIVVNTPDEVANGSGDQAKQAVDRLADSLKLKYGDRPNKTDYVGTGVYKRNPEFWMMGRTEDSVFYAYAWESKGDAVLPNDLRSVEVSAQASNISKSYAKIVYTFSNFDECVAEMKASKAQNL